MKRYSVHPVHYGFERKCDDDDDACCHGFKNTQIVAHGETTQPVFAHLPRLLALTFPSKNSGCRQELYKNDKPARACSVKGTTDGLDGEKATNNYRCHSDPSLNPDLPSRRKFLLMKLQGHHTNRSFSLNTFGWFLVEEGKLRTQYLNQWLPIETSLNS